MTEQVPSEESDTPKTDAAAIWAGDFGLVVDRDFARDQERTITELAEEKRKMLHALRLITDETGPAARRIAKEVLGMVKP